jgi:hypothetical protein
MKAMRKQDRMGRMPGKVLSWSTYQLYQGKEALRVGKKNKEDQFYSQQHVKPAQVR